MPEINQLSAVSALAAGDQLPVYSSAHGDARKASLTTLLAYLQANLDFTVGAPFITQYSAPSATGFSVAIEDGPSNIHLILTPVAGYADGTIVLPSVGNAVDGQMILVNCTQAVTTLVVDGNGATAVTGEPAALTANAFFTLKYDAPTSSWYRVG
jgi:hypothetical protein